jgi:hypothetical protein
MNDHVYRSRLGQALTTSADLDLQEVFLAHTGQHLTATYFRGTRPIDAIWTTPDIEVKNACALPIGYGVGDHRAFMIDLSTASLVGLHPQPVVRPQARRLNTKIPHCADTYNFLLETQILRHNLINKLHQAHLSATNPMQLQATLDRLDKISTECMRYAERCCRKLKSG